MLLLKSHLFVADLVTEQVLRKESDLLIDITRLLQKLIVHLGHPFFLNSDLLTETIFNRAFFSVVQSLLVLSMLFDEFIGTLLLSM